MAACTRDVRVGLDLVQGIIVQGIIVQGIIVQGIIETGHFQQMTSRTIGEVELAAGRQTLAVKPRSKPGVAVMDLRRVVLRPAP